MGNYKFINPYNFIPLLEDAPKRGMEDGEEIFSGVIEYSLLTKTPLIIPNTSNDNAFESKVEGHHSYDFFSYTDLSKVENIKDKFFEPVIPGSEMRGLIRSNYEIITNSCLSALDTDEIMSKRIGQIFKPGLLQKKEDGTFDLMEAEECLLRVTAENTLEDDRKKYNRNDKIYVQSFKQDSLKEGQGVSFRKEKRGRCKCFARDIHKGEDYGYVLKGEAGGKKHNCHIFVETKSKERIASNVNLKILDLVLTKYDQDKDIKKGQTWYQEYREEFDKFKKSSVEESEFFPVYYDTFEIREGDQSVQKFLYLSPASITRESYLRTLDEMAGEHKVCTDVKCLCPACSMFGTVINKNGKNYSKASKVKFSDLHLKEKMSEYSSCYMDITTLAELSSPKLNNMEFYLKKPSEDAVFWTYDYYITKDRKVKKNTAGINGRKFYWHNLHRDFAVQPEQITEQTNRNATVRPLKEGIQFHGRVVFEDLTKYELDNLIHTLNANEEGSLDKKKHGYKLGHAKPLGYGSIAVSVDDVKLRELSVDKESMTIQNQMVSIDYEQDLKPMDPRVEKDFAKMTCFETIGKEQNIDYPRLSPKEEIYKWFVNNHGNRMKRGRVGETFHSYLEPMNPTLVGLDEKRD